MSSAFGPVIAHRGYSARFPENTAAAFRAAHALHCDMVELDARLTADGEVVVVHDDRVERYGGTGRVADLAWSDLRALDAGSWFAPAFAGERVLLLREALELLGRLPVNVEVKVEDETVAERIAARTIAVVRQVGGNRVLYSTFSRLAFTVLRRLEPAVPAALLVGASIDGAIDFATGLDAEGLHVHERLASAGVIDAVHEAGLSLRTYTVNETQRMRALLDAGVDGIFTDELEKLQQVAGGQPGDD